MKYTRLSITEMLGDAMLECLLDNRLYSVYTAVWQLELWRERNKM